MKLVKLSARVSEIGQNLCGIGQIFDWSIWNWSNSLQECVALNTILKE